MIGFILRRLAVTAPLVVAVLVGTFLLVRLAPGDPLSGERNLPPEIRRALEQYYGLDQSLDRQLLHYLNRVARGDLGPSYRYRDRTVNQVIREGLPVSAQLGLLAYAVALVLGLLAGVMSATRPSSLRAKLILSFATLGISVPSFVSGPILILIFSFVFYLLPPAGWGEWRHLVLPVVTLSGVYVAYIAKLVKSGLSEVMQADFIRTVRSAGVPENRVLWKFGLRSAILPAVTFSGPAIAFLVTGTVVVEQIFAIPGLGHFFVEAATNRDYTLLTGIAIFVSAAVMLMNLVVDVAAAVIDPRVRIRTG
ncbi:MAG: ABC transporter permease [Acidobacteria bacterium]|nr:ABC transporter permease [Acidobacteriota bacterium]